MVSKGKYTQKTQENKIHVQIILESVDDIMAHAAIKMCFESFFIY